MRVQLEICANSVQSALNAEQGGADRVELCDNLWEGGTTPSYATIKLSVKYLKIPVFVLVRPRGGDFTYTDLEFEIMIHDITQCKVLGVEGIVSGVLLPDGNIDVEKTAKLKEAGGDLPFTFHRAFDLAPSPVQALEDVIKTGASRILTSGHQKTAPDGAELISSLIAMAKNRISILAGGGINRDNIELLIQKGCEEFHMSARSYSNGLGHYPMKVPMNGSSDIPEKKLAISDTSKILEIRKILDEIK